MDPQPIIPKSRKVYDTIYGFISFPQLIWEFIDTPEFQRLRNIKQLGCLSWVFPGAVHSRFQHSLGTGYLAQKYITTLIEKHQDKNINEHVWSQYYDDKKSTLKKKVREEAIFVVTLAGLLHDIGHGPYSHLFDSKVVKQIEINGKKKKWQHEIASICLIDSVYDRVIKLKSSEQDKQWLRHTKRRVKSLIIGKITQLKYKETLTKPKSDIKQAKFQEVFAENLQEGLNQDFIKEIGIRPWEFELISNRITGIDVDKLDYFRRDAYYMGAKNIYIDHELLMNQTLILQDDSIDTNGVEEKDIWKYESLKHRLCYPSKYFDKVFDIFYSRYKLYKTYYHSLKANGIDHMIAEILQHADVMLKMKQACKLLLQGEPTKYIKLTDSIIQKISDAYDGVNLKLKTQKELTAEDKQIMKAGQILQKLKERKIYDFVRQYQKSFKDTEYGSYHTMKNTIQDFIKQQKENNNDIVLHLVEIGFGIKQYSPFEKCKFYDKTLLKKKMTSFSPLYFSMLQPSGNIELSLRLYLKNRKKNPTKQQRQQIKAIEQELYKKIQSKGISLEPGQSGTYTVRNQLIPNIPVNPQNMQELANQDGTL